MHIRDDAHDIKSIRDLNSAAFILICNYELLGVSWNGSVAWWRFRDHDGKLDEQVRIFVNGKAVGNINQFANAQRILKQTLSENH